MSRTFVIGDIHGALRALDQLLDRISLRRSDRLIFLGDYVDGWSQSSNVLQRLMELNEHYTCIFIKGNHDVWCEEWLAGETPDVSWLLHGGLATVSSYETLGPQQRLTHLEFFNRMQNYHIDGGRLFIHAGFSSMHGPENEHYSSNYSWDRTLWETALATDTRIKKTSYRYPKRLLLFDEIYIGHTPTVNYDVYKPMSAHNVWNVDTGAAFDGRLTALEVHTKEYWQSDTVMSLYPGETGRNK
ncbi:MAG: metallophosphoesterase [Chitinophagaceae bacterium]|nr:metallophosphoesterase [Chitinophagaceae bacterium]